MTIIKCSICQKPLKGRICVRLVVECVENSDGLGWQEFEDQAEKCHDWSWIVGFHLECAQQAVDEAESAPYRNEIAELPLDELMEELSGPILRVV